MEIKKLKSELGKVSHETSPTTSLEDSTFVSEIGLSKETPILSREEDLVEIASLRNELEQVKRQADNDSSEYISLSSELEANRLREENENLRRKLEQLLSDGSLMPESVATAPVSHSEKKLKKEVAKLKEVNKLILKTAEEQNAAFANLEKRNADLRSEIENLQDASIAGLAADANSYGDLKARLAKTESRLKAEEIRAENAVARESKLRAEMADMRHVKDSLMSHQTISEEDSCDDMTTLQYEIERLRTELHVAKEEARSSGTFAADDMALKNELKRLAEAGIQKDFEIAKLKLRVST
jgi:chromosome segregation ATPase